MADDTDAPYNHRKKLRTVKSAESLVHHLKESSPCTSKEESRGSSHKSSPQVSVDSSNSSGVISPLPKSPGLQKHTRSSSHESYFESNGMDIISEPSFEDDEHGLFYYVSEQMRMLQDSTSWHSDCAKFNRSPEIQGDNKMEGIDENYINETEKNVRKQKSTDVVDGAQAKVQKLNETNPEPVENSIRSENLGSSSDSLSQINYSPEQEIIIHKSADNGNNLWEMPSQEINEFSPEAEGLAIDPMLLYDAILNKRCSIISSDTDNDTNNRTIVERYGNAETVLVEVHATQDSSSEEELCTNIVEKTKNETEPIVSNEGIAASNVVFDSTVETEEDGTEESDKSMESPLLKSPSPLIFDDMSVSIMKKEIESAEYVETSDNMEDLNVIEVSDSCDVKSPVETEDVVLEEECVSSPTEKKKDIIPDIFKDIKFRKEHVNLNFEEEPISNKDLPIKSESFKDVSPSSKPQGLDSAFSINTPPSPVYPPKSLKLQDFQSLKTKMETIPIHKKKQIIIPSPSSPVEEVRKKFELKSNSSSMKKTSESPVSETKSRPYVKELTTKHKKAFETSLPAIESLEAALNAEKLKQDDLPSPQAESLSLNKRHSEPPPKTECSPPADTSKRLSHKYESEVSQVPKVVEKVSKPKAAAQPSLFTQLKIRKLQSLQAEAVGPPPEPIDPWSDPILDMQEDYHPIIYSPSYSSAPVNDSDSDLTEDQCEDIDEPDLQDENTLKDESISVKQDCSPEVTSTVIETKMDVGEVSPIETKNTVFNVSQTESPQIVSKQVEVAPESEAVKRERINRIKEERRAQLREKLKPESFRLEAEEKEKVQTKFRMRKDCLRHGSTEDNSKDVKKSDKAVETDSTDITETGTNCDLSVVSDESSLKAHSSDKLSDSHFSSKNKKDTMKISEDYKHQSKSKTRSYDDSRKWLSMPPTDIRDKVAMFERSKEAKELCRLGPNGKFIQKQSPSALTSSFVR